MIWAQDCNLLKATFQTFESRCAATGSIKVSASGGSGNYKYKTFGPVNSNFTTTDSITGLSAGTYTVVINDIVSNCTLTKTGIVVEGSYEDPRFTLISVDVSCDNGNNGSISTSGLQKGRQPFTYSIVAPSPMGVGTTSDDGNFPNLIAGDYNIRLTDSCGGIQTRTVTINNYTWKIDSYPFTKFSCDSANGSLKVIDSKGRISTIDGIPGFTYGVVTQPGDTTWSANATFRIGVNGVSQVDVFAKDACGKIKKVSVPLLLIPSLDANIAITNKICSSFTASVSGVTNFSNPNFCLYDKNDVLISCNSSGVFTNLSYGNYCVKAHDACSDTTITRCFNAQPPSISIANDVIISNKNCNTFDVAITGQTGLTNPAYVLLLNGTVYKGVNSTGVFTALPYGDYCIVTSDGCRDTTITRCFSARRPTPVVDPVIIPSYVNCVNFGIVVGGDSLTLPEYCLFDTNHVKLSCNNTGIFDSIPLGSYCVTVHDACLDTTFTRCFSVGPPAIVNDVTITITNKTCSTFTASAGTSNLHNVEFCLYNDADVLIACDSSGIFNNLAYGSYCIKSKNDCPDTTVVSCFSASAPVPAVSGTVSKSNKTCTTFSAQITGQKNLTSPQYCLIDASNDTLACNSTGKFDNIPYGSYCIQIKNSCYDTTLKVCFSNTPTPFKITATASKSCNYGTSKFVINVTGTLPVNIKIYYPGDSLLLDNNYATSSISIDKFADLPIGLFYRIIAKDVCGNIDSAKLSPLISFLNHSIIVQTKCPGSVWANGSGNINATVTSNMGSLTVSIIKKDNNSMSVTPTVVAGSLYSFNDLGPATYILSYKTNDACNVYYYDTIIVPPYQYPNLNRSSAYQCDVNGFSVGAVASNGVGPFTYEIIGSTPAAPSILASPQPDPVFNIDNGFNYSLIRLRALDACGNATLGDASILPLANSRIKVSFNCFGSPSTLSVDTLYNSTYSWYKKTNVNDVDSVLIGTGINYFVPSVAPQDTGIYICHLMVNNGCITRVYYYNLNGDCYPVLPVLMQEFTGKYINDAVLLNWIVNNSKDLKKTVVERKTVNGFVDIAEINAENYSSISRYHFLDKNPADRNFYRLRLINNDGTFIYSQIIFLQNINQERQVQIYPNPATDKVNVEFNRPDNHIYKVSLLNMLNQNVKEFSFQNGNGNRLQIRRSKGMSDGMYILRLIDMNTNEEFSYKIIFTSK